MILENGTAIYRALIAVFPGQHWDAYQLFCFLLAFVAVPNEVVYWHRL